VPRPATRASLLQPRRCGGRGRGQRLRPWDAALPAWAASVGPAPRCPLAPSGACSPRRRAALPPTHAPTPPPPPPQVTAPGGLLAPSSCSSHLDAASFMELCREALRRAQRRGAVLGVYGQPLDHPYPLACEELRYLKFALIRLE
jgi:hypothetical protein